MSLSELICEMGLIPIPGAWDSRGIGRRQRGEKPAKATISAIPLPRDSRGMPVATGTSDRHLSRYPALFRGGMRDRRDAQTRNEEIEQRGEAHDAPLNSRLNFGPLAACARFYQPHADTAGGAR